MATEIILTLGQAFEVAYQLVLRQEIYSPCNGVSSQSYTAPSIVPAAAPAPTLPVAVPANETVAPAAPAVNNNNNNNGKPVIAAKPTALDPARKIGPKPTVLPPKPKLGTALFNQQRSSSSSGGGGNSISHARSHSSVDGVPSASSGAASAMVETRLLSESNLSSLQVASRQPPNNSTGGGTGAMISALSSASVSSTGSGRAPLAAKDEL